MSVRRPAALSVLAAAVLLLAACGGSSRLTKAELIKQGDVICKDARAKADPIGTNLGAPSQDNLSQWADALDQAFPIYQDMTGKLKALSPPEADQATWDQITGGLDKVVAGVKAAKDAAAAGDLAAFNTALQQVATASQGASQVATTYGFQECGTGSSGSGSSGSSSAPSPAASP